jgi:hypothetical protein
MRGLKSYFLAAAAAVLLLAPIAAANAQFSIGFNFGPRQPNCPFGYYSYSPYGCAPEGYYGPGYFYNGIFLGVGPWGGWGYAHGWGDHRFEGARGGGYNGNAGWNGHNRYMGGQHSFPGEGRVRGAGGEARGGFGGQARGGGGGFRGGGGRGGGGHGGGGGRH